MRAHPSLLPHRYIALTSRDSGIFDLDEQYTNAGWVERGGIVSSPLLLPGVVNPILDWNEEWPTFCELYISRSPLDLGAPRSVSLQEFDPAKGKFLNFVNYFAFDLGNHDSFLNPLFWQQMAKVQPECYLAENNDLITFVHEDRHVFQEATEWLSGKPPR